jgi:hypothetical protein
VSGIARFWRRGRLFGRIRVDRQPRERNSDKFNKGLGMEESSTNKLVDVLSTCCVANVQNGLIHALSVWLDEHIQGDSVKQGKLEAFYKFRNSVWEVVQQKQFQRKVWPENQDLPYPYNELEVISSLSSQILQEMNEMPFEKGLLFLAELWGRWILVCPDKIIQHSPEFGSYASSVKTETELIDYMFRYLDMVYGMLML